MWTEQSYLQIKQVGAIVRHLDPRLMRYTVEIVGFKRKRV